MILIKKSLTSSNRGYSTIHFASGKSETPIESQVEQVTFTTLQEATKHLDTEAYQQAFEIVASAYYI